MAITQIQLVDNAHSFKCDSLQHVGLKENVRHNIQYVASPV